MFDVTNCFFIYLVYFGVVWDRRINVSFISLCRLKRRSPCNQNSLNALWMSGTDFCSLVQTWFGICVGALGRPSLAGEIGQIQITFAMGYVQFSSVAQSCARLCNPITDACQVSLYFANSWSLFKLMWIESVMPSNHLILCPLLLLLPSIFPRNRVFSNEYILHISWSKYWSFNFSISPSNKHSRLFSFSTDWLDLLVVQWILQSLVQLHGSKAPILHHSPFFMIPLSHPYMITGKIIALIILNIFSKIMSLLLKILSRFVIDFLQLSKRLLTSWL